MFHAVAVATAVLLLLFIFHFPFCDGVDFVVKKIWCVGRSIVGGMVYSSTC